MALGIVLLSFLDKMRREWLMRSTRTVDEDLFPNHWLLGGAFDAPDPRVAGEHRVWELEMLQEMKKRYPTESNFKICVFMRLAVFLVDAGISVF